MDFLPGLIQGLVRTSVAYPFDYVRTFIQKNKFTGINDYFKSNKFNICQMYRGCKYSFMMTPIDRAITFKLYEDLNKQKYNPFISAFLVSILTCFYSVPIQSMISNCILNNVNKSYTISFDKSMIRNNFYRLYKSYVIEYLKQSIGLTIWLGLYGNLRNVTPDNLCFYMINGIFSNIISWTIIYPLDTIRLEHQTSNKTLIRIVNEKLELGGLRMFYRGINLIYLRSIPSASLSMMSYEVAQKLIK